MTGILWDSNILIDVLNGSEVALNLVATEMDGAYSIMTWMEVLAGSRTEEYELGARKLLATCPSVPITEAIAERAVTIRRTTRLKLIDATILATAQVTGRQLYTRNTRDFDPAWPGVVVPYTI